MEYLTMGLDMYATAVLPEDVIDGESIDLRLRDGAVEDDIHAWHKHLNLHAWMEQLYWARGGNAVFNNIPLRLSAEDLDHLESAILEKRLPTPPDVFVGAPDSDETEDDLLFIEEARTALHAGRIVLYSCWW